jgi:hypothetical protein
MPDPATCSEPNERSEPERFQSALDKAAAIKSVYVDKQITFYAKGKLTWPRVLFRLVGTLIIVCSASLPAFAAAKTYQAVTILSVSVAILSGLAAFFRWDVTWKGRIMARGTLEQLCAKWAVELTRAQECMKPEERIKHVCDATYDLIKNTNAVVSAESGTFFQGVKIPERVHTSKEN